jgi:hypothetical protein
MRQSYNPAVAPGIGADSEAFWVDEVPFDPPILPDMGAT